MHAVNEFTGTGQLDVNNIIISDESHIYLNGVINKKNFRKWSFKNHGKCLNGVEFAESDWCGLSSRTVYGPYFFKDPANVNNIRTVTTEAHIEMLETEFSGSNPPEVW